VVCGFRVWFTQERTTEVNRYGAVVFGHRCPERADHTTCSYPDGLRKTWFVQECALLGKLRQADGRVIYKLKCPYCLGGSGALPEYVLRWLRNHGRKVMWTQDNQNTGEVKWWHDYQEWDEPPGDLFTDEVRGRRDKLDAEHRLRLFDR
jgi:hypothetical protein